MFNPDTLLEIAMTMSAHVFLFDFGRYIIAASLVASLVWLLRQTRWASRKIQKREATRADFVREFTSSIRTVIVYVLVSIPVIWAFRNGGVPNYVMPIVFGGAPLINVLMTMAMHPPKDKPNPLLYVGYVVVAAGAAMVFYFKPKA